MQRRTLLKLTLGSVASAAFLVSRPVLAAREVTPMPFEAALQDGATFMSRYGPAPIRLQQIAELVMPSGLLIASDAFFSLMALPLARQVPPGRYPVILSIAHFTVGTDPVQEHQIVACASIRFRPETPVRWEMAVQPGADLATLEEGMIFGYPVDSATGCFLDAEAQRVLDALPEGGSADFVEALIDEFEDDDGQVRTWVDMTVDEKTGANLVAFRSGIGDGYYASYWGFDAAGEVVCIVTDFALD